MLIVDDLKYATELRQGGVGLWIGPGTEGQSAHASVRVQAPEPAGEAVLAIDLVHEGVAWFSDEGVPPATIPIRVR